VLCRRTQASRSTGSMVMIIPPNPANDPRERFLRLWHRESGQAVWMAANVAVGGVASLAVIAAPAVAAAYLTDLGLRKGLVVPVVVGAVVSLPFGRLARVMWRRWRTTVDDVTRVLLDRAVVSDFKDEAALTKMESDALVRLDDYVDEIERAARAAGRENTMAPFKAAKQRLVNERGPGVHLISRRQLTRRIQRLSTALDGAAYHGTDPTGWSTALQRAARETRRSIDDVRNGRPLDPNPIVWWEDESNTAFFLAWGREDE
jgi:hypothetical protein